ncbi:Uncharacterised protein [Mycobacteroides abscessus subsp. abscessus]|nr:Uncharacterised protein [Mycobacteroides abscessus subsp. abscessus]
MWRVWNSISDELHRPGTTMVGETPPSSLVMALSRTGWLAALRRAPSSPVPKTIASWVIELPVMWTWSTSWWCTR